MIFAYLFFWCDPVQISVLTRFYIFCIVVLSATEFLENRDIKDFIKSEVKPSRLISDDKGK